MTKTAGTVGTAAGVIAGRALLLPGLGATLGSVVLGPIGGVAGFAVGAWLEKKSRLGRFVGGMAGATVGVTLGKLADVVGLEPGKTMGQETRGFTYRSLVRKLWDPEYTSHQKLGLEKAKELMAKAQPGDLVITTHDENFNFEITQKLLGQSGDWTHVGVISQQGTILEVMINTDGPTESDPLRVQDEYHAMLLRPRYRDADAPRRIEQEARDMFGKVKYDFKFRMGTDDKQYCQEYVYKVVKDEMTVIPSKLFGMEYVTADHFINSPDVEVVGSTGSSFWRNWLSKFS